MLVRKTVRCFPSLVTKLFFAYSQINILDPAMASVYFGVNKVSFKEGTRDESLKGFEATMGKFYRKQPGHILYVFGACQQDPNALLNLHVWSDKALFDSLPQNAQDLEKLSTCRAPFMATIAEPPTGFITKHAVGNDIAAWLPSSDPMPDSTPESFDSIMGGAADSFQADTCGIVKSDLYFKMKQCRTKPGKAEAYAEAMDSGMGKMYREHQDCLLFLAGVVDEETALFCTLWNSKSASDAFFAKNKEAVTDAVEKNAHLLVAQKDDQGAD